MPTPQQVNRFTIDDFICEEVLDTDDYDGFTSSNDDDEQEDWYEI